MKRARPRKLQKLAAHLGLEVEFLEQVSVHGELLLDGVPDNPGSVSPAQLARLRRLSRLCAGLDLDVFAGALVVELLEREESLRRDLEDLRRRAR